MSQKSSVIADADGNEVLSSQGYRYFGAAKDLPGVRDLFRKQDIPLAKRSRSQMYKCADAAYFGYRDDDDAVLVPLEKTAEEAAVAAAVLEWTERQASGGAAAVEDGVLIPLHLVLVCALCGLIWTERQAYWGPAADVLFDLFCACLLCICCAIVDGQAGGWTGKWV